MFHVVVDSAADLPPALAAANGIHVIPIPVELDGHVVQDGVDLQPTEFYERLAASPAARTAAPAPGTYAHLFARLADDGVPVLSLSIAGALSATYNAAMLGAQLTPGAHIICLDSATISLPIGFLALHAARAARSDVPIEIAAQQLQQLRERTVLYFGLDTLEYVRRGGRIGRSAALVGGVLQVKPILQAGGGAMTPVTQVRTSKRIAPQLVELAMARGSYTDLGVLYTTDRVAAEGLAERCAAAGLLDRERIVVAQVGAGLGTHAGPGALGIAGIIDKPK